MSLPSGMIVTHDRGRSRLCAEAKDALLSRHYLRRLPSVSHAFQLFDGQHFVGLVTFGPPASRNVQRSACPTAPDAVSELNRLWLDDCLPWGIASALLAVVLRQMPAGIVVSYADTSVGHKGYVYRASNFFYAGETDADRKTPRNSYVTASGKHPRDTHRSGADFQLVRRTPKHRYWTVTGNPSERRNLQKIAGWKKLSWKTQPMALDAERIAA